MVFLKILQNSQETTYVRVSFSNKVAGLRPDQIMAQLLSFLFTTTISGFLALISLSHIITSIPQNLHFFIFNNTFWSMFIPFFISLQVLFLAQFPMNYSCNIIVPCLVLLVCQLFMFVHNNDILFRFSCHTFYKEVIGPFYLSCVSYSLFELPTLSGKKNWT